MSSMEKPKEQDREFQWFMTNLLANIIMLTQFNWKKIIAPHIYKNLVKLSIDSQVYILLYCYFFLYC